MALILHEPFPWRGLLRACVLIPWAIPAAVSGRAFELIYNSSYGAANFVLSSLGVTDTPVNWLGSEIGAFVALVVADAWKTTPFAAILLLAGLSAIPEDLYRQAMVDRANAVQRFYRITLPLLRPVLVVTVLFRSVEALRIFDLIFVLTGGGPGGSTLSLSLLAYGYFSSGDFGYASAVSVVLFFLALGLSVVYMRLGGFAKEMPVSDERLKTVLLGLGALLILLFSLSPFAYMVLTGLSRQPDFLQPGRSLEMTAEHYHTVLTADSLHFLAYLRNSLVVSAGSAIVAVFAASLAAYALTRLTLPGKAFFMLGTLAVSLFPPVSLVSYLFKFMAAAGWINTPQALILPYVAWTLPLSLWILVSYFSQVPIDLDRAALVDGCTRFQILRKIILPVALPGVVSTALLAFIFAFNEFLFALMLTTDYQARTLPVGIALFEGLHGQMPWGEIMAAATLTTIPVVMLALFFQRHIIQGLTRGAVKE